MTDSDTMKHFEQQTSSTLCSVLYDCILFIQNQVPYFKAVNDSNLTLLLLRKNKNKNKKKKQKKNKKKKTC